MEETREALVARMGSAGRGVTGENRNRHKNKLETTTRLRNNTSRKSSKERGDGAEG